MMRLHLFTLALGLVGCRADCPTWDELEVVHVSGEATEAELASYRAKVDEVATWTNLDGVCVPSIQVVRDHEPPLARHNGTVGHYRGQGSPIQVDAGVGTDTIAHELCHAIDSDLGGSGSFFSERYSDAFYEAGQHKPDYVYSERDKVYEGFAETCKVGPGDAVGVGLIEEACGSSPASEAWRLMHDKVFLPPTETDWIDAPPSHFVAAELDLRGLLGAAGLIDIASDGQHIVLSVITGAPVPGAHAGDHALLFVDPLSGELVADHRLRRSAPWFLAHGSGGEVGVYSLESPVVAQLWTVDGLQSVVVGDVDTGQIGQPHLVDGVLWLGPSRTSGELWQARLDLREGMAETAVFELPAGADAYEAVAVGDATLSTGQPARPGRIGELLWWSDETAEPESWSPMGASVSHLVAAGDQVIAVTNEPQLVGLDPFARTAEIMLPWCDFADFWSVENPRSPRILPMDDGSVLLTQDLQGRQGEVRIVRFAPRN